MQPSRNQRFHTGPTVFRDPNVPRPGGVIILREGYKGRNVVAFSNVPLAAKRTRGPNKRRRDSELLSSDEKLDTTESHGTRLNVPTGKLTSPSLSQSKRTARGIKISKTMLSKRGPDVKEALTPAERKRRQREKQTEEKRLEDQNSNSLQKRASRQKKAL